MILQKNYLIDARITFNLSALVIGQSPWGKGVATTTRRRPCPTDDLFHENI